MNPKSKEFLELKSKWYKKLEKSGFEDIEQDDEALKKWSNSIGRHESQRNKIPSIETYYRLAGQFLYDHKFKSKKENIVWKLHSEGLSIRAIVEFVKSKRFKNPYFSSVQNIIEDLRKEMLKEVSNVTGK